MTRLSGTYTKTGKLERLINHSTRVFLPSRGSAIGDLEANQFLGRDVPVRLFPDGLGMADVVDACIYMGQTPDKVIEVEASSDADPDYVAKRERRRRLMPRPGR